jgi:hypothetical protein
VGSFERWGHGIGRVDQEENVHEFGFAVGH